MMFVSLDKYHVAMRLRSHMVKLASLVRRTVVCESRHILLFAFTIKHTGLDALPRVGQHVTLVALPTADERHS